MSIRDAGYGITVICQGDVARARENGSPVPFTLPMNQPTRHGWAASYRCYGFPVAYETAIDYSEFFGGSWSTHLLI